MTAPPTLKAKAAPPRRRPRVFTYDFANAGKGPALFGVALILPVLLIAGLWAAFAPLNSAAIASGQVVLNFERKTVQHLEGGLVLEIMAEEGQFVEKGQPLLSMRDLPQRAEVNTLHDRLVGARARYRRLWAEMRKDEAPDFRGIGEGLLLERAKIDARITLETHLFNTRRANLDARLNILGSYQEQTRTQIEGLQAQLEANRARLALERKEFGNIEAPVAQGFIAENRKIAIEKQIVELEGRSGDLVASIAQLEQSIDERDLAKLDARTTFQNAVLDEIQAIELEIREMAHTLSTITDQLKRTVVRAPVSGRVLDLQIHTPGAVIGAGQKILDIVPQDDKLIIEARVRPIDIDLVKRGTKARIQLSAYRVRQVPKIDGEVVDVSGDILVDPMTGEQYFAARILVNEEDFAELSDDIILYPGMPAEVFLISGERTVADYLLSPVLFAVDRAFREE